LRRLNSGDFLLKYCISSSPSSPSSPSSAFSLISGETAAVRLRFPRPSLSSALVGAGGCALVDEEGWAQVTAEGWAQASAEGWERVDMDS